MNKLRRTILMAMALFLMTSSYALALQYGFENITANDIGDATIGEAQLFVDVTEYSSDPAQVLFKFTNVGPEASSITDIYFDDDIPVLDGASASLIYYTTGVKFSEGASPTNLPGGNDPSFAFTADYSYDSEKPTQPMGINPEESMGILFNLAGGFDYNDILAALDSGELRIGIHVQGFASEGSEAFINTPINTTTPTPEPSTVFLLSMGMLGFVALRKKFGKSN